MRIAITGASGFIGRHLVSSLAANDRNALIAIARSASTAGFAKSIQTVDLDIAEADDQVYRRIGSPDVLVHLAWGGLPNYLSLHHFEHELPIQFRFLRAMVEGGLPALVVTGTCYEYGLVNGELVEDASVLPANPYAHAKLALLRQLQFLQASRPFALTWARLFYMWGEGQAPGSIYPSLMAAAARGDPLFPMSHGEQLRDYLPVVEVARILAELTLLRTDTGVVNVSSGTPTSMRRLVEGWIAEHGLDIIPQLGSYPYPTYEPLAFWGSPAKRRALLEGNTTAG